MRDFPFNFGKESLSAAISGETQAFTSLFYKRVENWGQPFICGEYGYIGLFADLLSDMEEGIAFDLIPTAVDLCLKAQTKENFICALDLVSNLAITSQTTQIPDTLKASLSQLEDKVTLYNNVDSSGAIHYIKEWYRLL